MYLLIQSGGAETLVQRLLFTFHNVSINSGIQTKSRGCEQLFTFHNVSINSYTKLQKIQAELNLHSIMYLLILAICH